MLYLFDNKEELVKIIPNKDVVSAEQTMELKKVISLDVEVRGIDTEELKKAEYIGHFRKDIFYLYKILRVRTNITTTIKAVHVAFDELKSNGYIRDKRPTNTTASIALSIALEGTRWEVGTVATNKVASSNWYDKTHLEALTDILNKWDVEISFRILFDGQKIFKRYVDISGKLGTDTGTRIVYGTNTAEVIAETNRSSIYTAIIGRGKGEQKLDEEGEATGGYGRRINFKEIEWSLENGDPLGKPLGEEILIDPIATKQFGFGGQPRTKIEVFGDCTDPRELLELSYKRLMQINRPLVSFKSTVNKLENDLDLGDTVSIIRRDLNLFYKTRVYKLVVNLLDNAETKVYLGDYIASNTEKQQIEANQKITDVTNKVEEVEEEIGLKVDGLLTDLKEGIELSYFNDNAYNYELGNDNKWELPAGYYSFNRPIDSNPSKVIFFGAGKLMIANKKNNDGSWDWSTFGTGDGFIADMITTGTLKGSLIEAGSIKGDRLEANSITSSKIKANSITGDKIKANSITGDKIKAGEINADKITTRSIKAENIDFGEIGYDEIGRHAVEGGNVARKTLDSDHVKELKVDILRPGNSNRIIFEGDNPGSNYVKSIDSTGTAIRLKKDDSNYVYVDRNGIEFYTGSGKTWTRNGTFYGENFDNTSDIRAKENIKYIGSKSNRIKRNEEVEVLDLEEQEILDFLKEIKIATYNYQFQDRMQVGAIAQGLEKVDKIGKYLVKEDKEEKRKYINVNNLIGLQLVGTREVLKEIEDIKRRLDNAGIK